MLKECTEILKNRPYFGGEKNNDQVRVLREIKLYINLIEFNIYTGASRLIHVVTYPFMVNIDWCIYYEELGSLNRRGHSKRLCLCEYSVIPYCDGRWETERCLLKTNITNPEELRIKTKDYQP